MKIRKEEDAVSPVIGIILLVALTVVFAAIVAGVVMGISKAPEIKDVGLTVDPYVYTGETQSLDWGTPSNPDPHYPTYGGIVVLVHGGKDADDLTALNVTIIGNASGAVFIGQKEVTYLNKDLVDASKRPYSEIVGIPLYYALTYDGIYQNPYQLGLPPTTEGNIQIIVTGTFTDGTEQVIYKGWRNWPAGGGGSGAEGVDPDQKTTGIFGDGRFIAPNDLIPRDTLPVFDELLRVGFRQSPNITRT